MNVNKEEQGGRGEKGSRKRRVDVFEESGSESESEGDVGDGDVRRDEKEEVKDKKEEEEVEEEVEKEAEEEEIQDPSKLKKEKILKLEKKISKTGVIYISKVPPYLKPTKMRQILERFGKVDRLFLKPETQQQHLKRVKYGSGNKKKMYSEGWAEFVNKKDAKLCVATLNGQTLGGKKGSFYYDDIMNLKYLHKFKWMDLTNQMAEENEARASKLMMEISTAGKLNKEFIDSVENKRRGKKREKKSISEESG